MASETVKIGFKNKIILLNFEEFDEEIDVDELCKIDYSNLYAEFVTIAALMNRVGIWKAESENDHAEAKLARDIYCAETGARLRRTLKTETTDYKGNPKTKPATKDEIDDAVLLDTVVQNHYKKVIRLQKEYNYMDSLYWAIKSKEMKLNKLIEGMNITPEDFEKELIEGKYNGIIIKSRKKLIGNKSTKNQ